MKNLLLFLLACSLGAADAARQIRGSVYFGVKPFIVVVVCYSFML